MQANWKLIFENYSECYHCPGVHPMLSKISPFDSSENDLSEGPFLGGFMSIAQGKSLTMSGNACALPVGNIKGEDHARVFYYSIFPEHASQHASGICDGASTLATITGANTDSM